MNVELSGNNHSIKNSLVTTGKNKLPGGVDLTNNYQFDLDGARVGISRARRKPDLRYNQVKPWRQFKEAS